MSVVVVYAKHNVLLADVCYQAAEVYGSAYFWGCKNFLPKFDLAFPNNV